jgi:V8-like Glu-specific endopeptidase
LNNLLSIILGLSILTATSALARNKVVYGEDNRIDAELTTDPLYKKLTNSTAGAFALAGLTDEGDHYSFKKVTIEKKMRLCKSERFSQQYVGPGCSGFLVGPNLLVTAGHCVNNSEHSKMSCSKNVWVFGYTNTSSQSGTLDKKDVYKCKSILNHALNREKQRDFALIELDRVVEGRTPLKFRTEGKVEVNTDLVVIGHPSTLPMKIADGARVVQNSHKEFFMADLDTFGGNSGSPVFDARTGQVEGILVRGAKDYVFDRANKCAVVNNCDSIAPGYRCGGESATHITNVEINKFL